MRSLRSWAWRFVVLHTIAIGASVAADYPNRAIRLVVPYAAGVATDVDLLHKEIVATLADPAVRERILAQESIIVGSTPAEFDAHIKAELAKWSKVAKETGIKADI